LKIGKVKEFIKKHNINFARIPHILLPTRIKIGSRDVHYNLLIIINLMKIGTVEHILYLRVYVSMTYKFIALFE